MAEHETLQQFLQTNYFNADDSYAVIFEAGVFDALFKHDVKLLQKSIEQLEDMIKKGLTIEEGIKALTAVYNDGDIFISAFQTFDIGTQEEKLIRLTDVRDKKVINKVRGDLKKRAEANPDRKMLIFYGFAGHGMQVDGEQVVIINQLNKRTGFYEWWAVEADIRLMAKKYSNTFNVGIFACCREIFNPSKHCGLFEGTKQEALDHF